MGRYQYMHVYRGATDIYYLVVATMRVKGSWGVKGKVSESTNEVKVVRVTHKQLLVKRWASESISNKVEEIWTKYKTAVLVFSRS